MTTTKLLTGIAVLSILTLAVGSLVSLPAALETAATVVTGGLLAAAMLAVVGAGVGGAGGRGRTRTPYW